MWFWPNIRLTRNERCRKPPGNDILEGAEDRAVHIFIATLFLGATACIIKANIIFNQILNEVNAKRPPAQQFSFIFVNIRAFEITREHARLFPESQKRTLTNAWAGIGFALGLVSFFFWAR